MRPFQPKSIASIFMLSVGLFTFWPLLGQPPTPSLENLIAEVKSGSSMSECTNSAQHLAQAVKATPPAEIDDKTIDDLTSLLDMPYSPVRFWIATALGNIGPRAKRAVPRFLQLWPEAPCLNGPFTEASAIRFALEKMGIPAPPLPPSCHSVSR